jgi:exopolysaccharide/PEP-CTERM locus tyrosine autokinase
MADNAPSLIERAAARLREPAAKGRFETTIPSAGGTQPPAFRPEMKGQQGLDAVGPSPADTGSRTVTISPISLASNGVVLPSENSSRTVQEFRAVKREIFSNIRRSNGTKNRVVVVTSARPGEGKTYTSTNLALAFAYEQDTRVLLIDGDAYRHSMLDYLGISAEKGWLDIITDATSLSSVVLRTNLPNLELLPAGKERSGIPELMSSGRMTALLEQLQNADPSRIIIIDSVPCLTSTEPAILSELAGQTLLVVAADDTARDDIEASLRALKASASVNLILNKTHPWLAEQFRGYSYNYAARET